MLPASRDGPLFLADQDAVPATQYYPGAAPQVELEAELARLLDSFLPEAPSPETVKHPAASAAAREQQFGGFPARPQANPAPSPSVGAIDELDIACALDAAFRSAWTAPPSRSGRWHRHPSVSESLPQNPIAVWMRAVWGHP